jgi:hypothetical protein
MKSLVIVIALFASVATYGQARRPTQPSGWKRITACGAAFYVPPDVQEESVRGIDSCLKQYRGENMLIMLDVLGYITPSTETRRDEYSEERDFTFRRTKVGGRRAEIITCYETDLSDKAKGLNYSSVLWVPQGWKDGGNLTIWINTKSAKQRRTAMNIFQSVRFLKH